MNRAPSPDGRRSLPSLLPPPLKHLLAAALSLAVFMLANTLYLVATSLAYTFKWNILSVDDTTLPALFQVMVLAHTAVGLLLVIALAIFVAAHLPKVWKRYHQGSAISGVVLVSIGVILAATGLFIATDAANRDNRWAWWTHVALAGLVPAAYAAHRLVSYVRPSTGMFRRFALATATLTVILTVWHGLTTEATRHPDPTTLAGRADSLFIPAGFVPASHRFFPSATRTASGGLLPARILLGNEIPNRDELAREINTQGFNTSSLIGATSCERCHQDIVAQWAASAHRFASFNNPFYEATVNDLRENSSEGNAWIEEHAGAYSLAAIAGPVKSQWCAGCHDPALLLTGQMALEVDRSTAAAQAGLTCNACHTIQTVHTRTGNGGYTIGDTRTDPYLFSGAATGTFGAFIHDAILRSKPAVHKRLLLNSAFSQAEYCSVCHKVSLPEPVNNYRWLRGQNEFDNWDDSGVSLNASRTFYLPAERRTCQDCHMPPEPAPLGDVAAENGFVRSHRFLAVNTALPFVRGDQETIDRIERFLRDEKLSVDIFALRRSRSRLPLMGLASERQQLVAGDRVTVDVVVRNRGVGHTFPGGTNDSNEGWLEFTLLDERGDTIAMSGFLDENGYLDSAAHVYKAVIVDRNGNQIQRRNAQDIYVTVFANVIGPGSADIAHYEFLVPADLVGRQITLRARLLWRKFDRAYTEFAFAANPRGFAGFDAVPNLPVTEISADEVALRVSATASAASNTLQPDSSEWVRYNDYGIGLLREGDTRGAARAFERVANLKPNLIDGPLNLARTALRDGNLADAYSNLRRSETIDPGNTRAAWVWGTVLQEDGRYQDAVAAYLRVLEEFPRDRATWRNLGRTYYLNQQYEDALAALETVLEIDPEDRIAHYHVMLSYRALGREGEAEQAREAFEYYQIDESAQEVARAFRQNNPGANLMAQPVRTHVLEYR